MNDQKFRKTLEAIRSSSNRDDLATATRTNLKLLLAHPSDQKLLESLLAQADTITSRLPAGEQPAEIRQAAVRCTVLLESAKKAGAGKPVPRNRRMLILALAATAVAALYAVLLLGQPR